jgi:hypothetical protein
MGLNRSEKEKTTKPQSNNKVLVKELKDAYIGKRYDPEVADVLINKYGYPETLEGTNNNIWIAYFPLGDFTMRQTKGDYIIVGFKSGKHPN